METKQPLIREIYPVRLEREVEPKMHRAFVDTEGLVEAEQASKVEALRAKIASGDYRPDPTLIAERMLAALCPSIL
ncbi:flagellar biosynthesis anti-sigma factor FlgM [Myxococcota bacterium]|nr:flagellar biosynthesis anti-sigma factor FlgM [Myxococcota bacterium]